MVAIEGIRRILLIRTDRFGETVLNLPLAASLKTALPKASLTWLINPSLGELIAQAPWVDNVWTYTPPLKSTWWGEALYLARALKASHFDLAVVSNPRKAFHVGVWLAGIPYRVGYDRKWSGFLTHRVPDRKRLGGRHEVECNLDLVRSLGFPASAPQRFFPSFENEHFEIDRILERAGAIPSKPLIVVHPWTSNPAKQWPTERFSQLIRSASASLPATVVVIGSAEERPRVPEVVACGGATVDLVGRLSLRQLAALLERARVVVSNDSGPAHLAAAVGAKTIVLFGTSDPTLGPSRWGPWGEGHIVIQKPSMEEISVTEVAEALEEQWGCPVSSRSAF